MIFDGYANSPEIPHRLCLIVEKPHMFCTELTLCVANYVLLLQKFIIGEP